MSDRLRRLGGSLLAPRGWTDLHTHTSWCDGKDTPAGMAEAAARLGLSRLGFSGHSHTPFDESYCMSVEGTEAYRREVEALKPQYAGRLEILCGIEQDYDSDMSTAGYDYVIGSVHYLDLDGEYVPVDEGSENLRRAAERHFCGDVYAVVEAYFAKVARVVEKTGCDLIGHFDLIAKCNEKDALFDEHHPRYVAAWQAAAEALLQTGLPFEINTGAISRGYRSVPYPSPEIVRWLQDRGARLILSSDAHSARTLCYRFREYRAWLDR